jgi:hypothetical protein
MHSQTDINQPSQAWTENERYLNITNAESVVTREGWPLLTVGTEVNGDSKSTNVRGPSLGGSLGSFCRYKILLSCLGYSGLPSTKYFSLTVNNFRNANMDYGSLEDFIQKPLLYSESSF